MKIIPSNLLRVYRKKKGFRSQWKLSLASGVAQSRISLIENKLINPSTREKILLSKVLDMDIFDIFPKYDRDEDAEMRGDSGEAGGNR